MEVTARLAVPGDAPDVARLAALAVAELSAERGAHVWLRHEARRDPPTELAALASSAPADGELLVVGTIDGAVTGFAAAHADVLHDAALLGVITELFVETAGREVGVGDAMAALIVDHFHRLGAIGVDAWALPGARLTKNFWEAHGFTARAITVHHRFVRDETGTSG